jgi:hypothetical protein
LFVVGKKKKKKKKKIQTLFIILALDAGLDG